MAEVIEVPMLRWPAPQMETALSAETTLRDIFHESDTNPKGGRERFQRPLGVFAESQLAFRSDLLPEVLHLSGGRGIQEIQ